MRNKNKVLAVVLARSGSSRLKNKMFLKFGNKIVIDYFIERLKLCNNIDKIILATTYRKKDDIFIKIAKKQKIRLIRGPEKDVVKRIINAININNNYNYIVRANADNPLFMPSILDNDIRNFIKSKYDLFTPFDKNFMPFGYSLTIFKKNTLLNIHKNARLSIYREHVENYCLQKNNEFKILRHKKNTDYYFPNAFLSLDKLEDYSFLLKCEKFISKYNYLLQPKKLINFIKKI